MQIKLLGIVNRVYKTEHTTYYTVSDQMQGGDVSFSLNGVLEGVNEGDIVQVEGNVKAARGKNGMYLVLLPGEHIRKRSDLKIDYAVDVPAKKE
jgi:hypothetical protein